ncbi:uncharacterized protein LOC122088002 [Macadamia integrifolia]|uniref:uncharacterized protein LOC122088002 n=1 Tax=Macadamia integrifolia TaxID=60698 RepID=UPI001C4FDF18|nr:uncharacterized protein LOC122088002 [Macadamia integrifolia]
MKNKAIFLTVAEKCKVSSLHRPHSTHASTTFLLLLHIWSQFNLFFLVCCVRSEMAQTILASNWQGRLNTIKADAKGSGSKEEIHTSKIKYLFKKGKPYIRIPSNDLHNVITKQSSQEL